MDLAAIAETAVEMWILIDAKLIARKQTMLDPEIRAQIFSEAMKLYMTQIINEKKYSTKPVAEQPTDDEHCKKCGRKFTDKEIGFLEGRTGDERICYHCSH